MRFKIVLLSVFAAFLALFEAMETRAFGGETSGPVRNRLITRNSAGPVHIGMTVAQARKAMPGVRFARTTDGEGMALIELKRGKTLEIILYAGEENAEKPISEKAKIEMISIFGPSYRTAEGVYPGMPLKEVEKVYGKLVRLTMSEIESREYAEFAHEPAGLSFRAGLPEIGIAGIYQEGSRETKSYQPSAVVTQVEISGR